MKRCPECRRDYYDDSLLYCLEDGAALVQGGVPHPEEPQTAILSEPPASAGGQHGNEGATRAQIHPTERTATLPSVITDLPRRSVGKRFVVASALIAVIAIGAFFGYRYLSANGRQIESIAVMPFVNESGNADVEYLSDGMAETLISNLSSLPNLNVKPRSSVFRYKGKDVDSQTIGKELNVQAILNGKVVQRGTDISLFVELIDISLDKVIWSQTYNRSQTDLVKLQSDVARDVSNRLQTRLSGTDEARVTKVYTADPEAYELYLKGNFYKDKFNRDSYQKAIDYYQRAIAKDPKYALPYVGMGWAYNTAANWYLPANEAEPKVKAAALKAIELDDSIAEAYNLLGIYEVWYGMDWEACERDFKRSIDLGSKSAHGGYAYYLLATGKLDQAVAEFKRDQSLNPLNLNTNTNAAFGYVCAGRYDEAIDQARKTIELDPNHWGGYETLGLAYAGKRQYPEAIAALEKARSLDNNNDIKGYLGYVYAISGDSASAHKSLDELMSVASNSFVSRYNVAFVYAGLNDRDKAFEWLNRGFVEDRSAAIMNVDPPFQDLRDDPRYKDLRKRMNLPE
jgi:serine/threonine-protein kinase